MRVESNFLLSEQARDQWNGPPLRLRVEHTERIDMQVGDLLSLEEALPAVFIISRRHFHWVDPNYVQIEYTLDIHHPA